MKLANTTVNSHCRFNSPKATEGFIFNVSEFSTASVGLIRRCLGDFSSSLSGS